MLTALGLLQWVVAIVAYYEHAPQAGSTTSPAGADTVVDMAKLDEASAEKARALKTLENEIRRRDRPGSQPRTCVDEPLRISDIRTSSRAVNEFNHGGDRATELRALINDLEAERAQLESS